MFIGIKALPYYIECKITKKFSDFVKKPEIFELD